MQKNVLFLLTLVFMLSLSSFAQRGVRIAYIDTEYILENVPEYQEATAQLNSKAQKWKNEIQLKLAEVEQQRTALNNEKALLTSELFAERKEDIEFTEKEILDYQQKRFGPNGDLFIQKKQLMQPIQDQIFAAVQDLAKGRQYDFIFDKSSDATMLFSAKQYDLSEQILRTINRSSKRKQAQTKAERKAAKDEELIPEINEELEAREKALEEKKAARESAIEKARQEKLAAREAKVKAAEEKRKKTLEEREKAKQAKLDTRNQTTQKTDDSKSSEKAETALKSNEVKPEHVKKTRAELIEENRQKKLKQREERKKALEERKQKILEERQKKQDSI
ncbi:OmpH family outer membrane protein [Tamlana fucoidanivorans]|uniref:OmpH family outer membrane protein n=1 Tax=Allotamlana fucoidanivorans TaxID=2583814 RepID=A0A5C4SF39_9FLAO|nr:OmpH family outer membrane protein [Tamlana fucoidanivorans]TNJ41899.1 OmpH family outer membrane protein [Tamlana fucoidanivorans]